MKSLRFFCVLSALFCLPNLGYAQWDKLKGFLKSEAVKETVKDVASNVLGGNLSAQSIAGSWGYQSMCTKLESEDDVLSQAADALASSVVDEKLNEYAAKIGIKPNDFIYTFNPGDTTFVHKTPLKGDLRGTYSVNAEAGTVTLNYGTDFLKLGSVTGFVTKTENEMKVMFEADKLMELFKQISTRSKNQTINSMSKLLNRYKGLRIGFKLASMQSSPQKAQ